MSVSKALKCLREEAARLNDATTMASKTIEKAELYLRESKLGVSAVVNTPEGMLGFVRTGSQGQYCIGQVFDNEVKRWQECSRPEKIWIACNIQLLIDRLSEEIRSQSRFDENALAEIERVSESISELGGDDEIPF